MNWRGWVWLLAVAGLLLACALRFSFTLPIQTNLLALLPETERNPVAEQAVARLGEFAGNRATFLVGHAREADAQAAARHFAAKLREDKVFREVQADVPAFDLQALAAPYLNKRFNFLSPADRQALGSTQINLEERLQRKLYSPFRVGLSADPAADPFGFFDGFFASLPFRNMRLELQDGLLVAHSGTGKDEETYVLVSAELDASSYDAKVQHHVHEVVGAAEQDLKQAIPETTLLRTGAVFFAGAARTSAQQDVDLIGTGSLIGVVLLLLAVFRSVRPLLLGLVSVGIGLAVATAVTLLLQGELHLLTLVFGASLIGEAVDYSIQYFAAYAAAGADWEPAKGLKSVRPGLSLALGTSVLGYSTLMLVPFPAISQIALFALVGLIAAFLTVLFVLPGFLRKPYLRNIDAITQPSARFLTFWKRRITRRHGLILILLVVILCIPGWLSLQTEDDIHLLIKRPDDLAQQETRIRQLTGFDNSSQFFLIEAASAETLLQREETLLAQLDTLVAKGQLNHYQGLSAFVPSAQRQAENRALLQQAGAADGQSLGKLFAQVGFRDEIAARQARDFADSATPLTLEDWLAAPISTPYRHLWLGKTAQGYAALVLPFGFTSVQPLAQASANLPGITLVDKADSVSRLFRQYRLWGSAGLAFAALAVYALLAYRYAPLGGAATLLPTLLGMGVALAVCGYSGSPISLFNVMGLMLVLGVGVNYAIFLQEGSGREGMTLTAVLLSAATALLSFGLLAFCAMPALALFGLTLLVGIGAAVVLSPLALTFGMRREAGVGT